MKIQITAQPCLLLESVELLYAFVNGVPITEIVGEGTYCISKEAAQEILMLACAGLSPRDTRLQYYFGATELEGDMPRHTCLARNIAYTTMNFSWNGVGGSEEELRQQMEQLRRHWAAMDRDRTYPTEVTRFALGYSETDCQAMVEKGLSLAQIFDRLNAKKEHRDRLLWAFQNFEACSQELEELIRPVAKRLAALLAPWALRAEPLAHQWQTYFDAPDQAEKLVARGLCSPNVESQGLYIGLRYLNTKYSPGQMEADEEGNLIRFHISVSVPVERKAQAELEDKEYAALRLLGSPARMRMLQAMAEKPQGPRGLARELGLHLGTVGRDLNSMFEARLLVYEYIDGHDRYRTNFAMLDRLADYLKSIKTLGEKEK